MKPEEFLTEATTLKNFRHPKILSLFAVCSLEEPFYIVTELMTRGDLLVYLQESGGQKITYLNLIDIAGQVRSDTWATYTFWMNL